MLKNISKLGKTLNKVEQKEIGGGKRNFGFSDGACNESQQNQINCSPGNGGGECDLDAYCSDQGRCTCA